VEYNTQSKPIRVLYIQAGRGFGGSKISLLHFLNPGLPGVHAELVVSPPVDDIFMNLLGAGVKTIHTMYLPIWYKKNKPAFSNMLGYVVSILRGWYLIPVLRLVFIILHNRIDLIHTNNSATPVGALAAKLTNRPHLWHIREPLGDGNQFPLAIGDNAAALLFRNLSVMIICNSHYTASFFKTHAIPTKIIQNGLILDDYEGCDKRGAELRMSLSLPGTKPVVGMVGSLGSDWKEHDLFLDAMALVMAEIPTCRFVVFGSETDLQKKDYTRKLALQAQQLKLEGNLSWVGPIKDVPAMMASLDILVHPTSKEGSGRVVMEAMAAGKPVVGVRSGGVQELIRDGKTGYLTPPRDAKRLSECVLKLIGDGNLLKNMGNCSREIAQAQFSHDHTQSEILALYSKTLESKARKLDKNY